WTFLIGSTQSGVSAAEAGERTVTVVVRQNKTTNVERNMGILRANTMMVPAGKAMLTGREGGGKEKATRAGAAGEGTLWAQPPPGRRRGTRGRAVPGDFQMPSGLHRTGSDDCAWRARAIAPRATAAAGS